MCQQLKFDENDILDPVFIHFSGSRSIFPWLWVVKHPSGTHILAAEYYPNLVEEVHRSLCDIIRAILMDGKWPRSRLIFKRADCFQTAGSRSGRPEQNRSKAESITILNQLTLQIKHGDLLGGNVGTRRRSDQEPQTVLQRGWTYLLHHYGHEAMTITTMNWQRQANHQGV